VKSIRRTHLALGAAMGVWLMVMAGAAGAQADKNPAAAKLKNPVKPTAESIAAGQAAYAKYCKFCHGDDAKGDGPLAKKDTHPPNLVDAKWEHGSTDGEIFTNISEGIGPNFDMKPLKTKIADPNDIWNIVNYLRSIAAK
jgi:mono/diheme cytochrome c family protein